MMSRLSTAAFTIALSLSTFALALNVSVAVDAAINGMGRLDFAAFWTAGRIVRDGQAPLYDLTTQRSYQKDLPDGRFYPFLNPPHVAALFAALALPYKTASRIWAAMQACLMLLLGLSIWRATTAWATGHRLLAISTVLGSAVVGYGVVNGSLSLLMAVAVFQWYAAIQSEKQARAGLWLVLASFKPQLIILPVATLFKRKRALISFVAAYLIASIVAVVVLGPGVWADYFSMTRVVQSSEANSLIPADTMPNLKGLLLLVGLTNGLALLISGVTLICFAIWTCLRSTNHPLSIALVVSLGLFLSPHLNVYDLSVLALPCILIYSHTRSRLFAWISIGVPLLMNISYLTGHGVWTVRLSQLFLLVLVCWKTIAVLSLASFSERPLSARPRASSCRHSET